MLVPASRMHTKSNALLWGMPGQIVARGKNTWLVRIPLGRDQGGKRVYHNKTLHGPKKDAEKYLYDALRKRDLGGIAHVTHRVTVGELLNDVLSDYAVNDKDQRWAEQKIRLHLGPAFGHQPANRVTTADIETFKEMRKEASAKNATINRELALLKRAFRLGMRSTPAKVANVPFIRMLEEKNVRKGFFESAEFEMMRRTLPEFLRPVLTFAYHTGCRRGEILALQWHQVDIEERCVRLEPGETKNDESRIIPLTGELLAMLKLMYAARTRETGSTEHLFVKDGMPIRSFRSEWEAACKACGFWDATANRPKRLFHDLRRTGVRNLVRAGVPERVAMAISGHKTRSVFDRYNITSLTDLKRAAASLDAYLATKSPVSSESEVHTACTLSTESPVN